MKNAKVIPLLLSLFFVFYLICGCGQVTESTNWNLSVIDRFTISASSAAFHATATSTIAAFGAQPSLAFTSGGNPRIAYYSIDNYSLKYAYPSNGAWTTETVDSALTGAHPSLALDSKDLPHIIYNNIWFNSKLMYVHNTGSTWESESLTDGSFTATSPTIKIGTDNIPRICFYGLHITYMTKPGITWETTTIATSGDSCSMVLGQNNIPHVAFTDEYIRYAKLNNSTWEIETVASKPSSSGTISIALDSQDNPYISYHGADSSAANAQIWYAYKSSGTWHAEKVYPSNYGYETSIAIDSLNNPHIAHYGSFGKGTSGLQYSSKVSSEWVHDLVEYGASISYRDVCLKILNNQAYITYYNAYTNDLKYATQK